MRSNCSQLSDYQSIFYQNHCSFVDFWVVYSSGFTVLLALSLVTGRASCRASNRHRTNPIQQHGKSASVHNPEYTMGLMVGPSVVKELCAIAVHRFPSLPIDTCSHPNLAQPQTPTQLQTQSQSSNKNSNIPSSL